MRNASLVLHRSCHPEYLRFELYVFLCLSLHCLSVLSALVPVLCMCMRLDLTLVRTCSCSTFPTESHVMLFFNVDISRHGSLDKTEPYSKIWSGPKPESQVQHSRIIPTHKHAQTQSPKREITTTHNIQYCTVQQHVNMYMYMYM